MKFTEKSLTQPGMAFTAADLLRRSKNGTMPAVYQESQPYDFEDFYSDGKQVTYSEQESYDGEPLPSFPTLEDLFELRDRAKDLKNDTNMLIKKHLEDELKAKQTNTSIENNETL